MGEYAEDQLRFYYRRVWRDSFYRQAGRNPIAGRCPHCGKGVRPLGGRIEESMAAHVRAKHPEQNGNQNMNVWRRCVVGPCARPTHRINGNHHNSLASWRSGDAADCKSAPRFSHIIMKSNDIRGFAVPSFCAADRRTYAERGVNVWQKGKL